MKKSILPPIAVAMFLAGCGDDNSTKTSQVTNSVPATNVNYNTGNPLTAPVDYLGAVMQAQKYAEKQIDLASVNQAIQAFNAGEGRFPKDLQEMIPNYLAKIPEAPYGYKIVYDANAGTVQVVKQ